MKNKYYLLSLVWVSFLFSQHAIGNDSFFNETDKFLGEYVKHGKVNYQSVSSHPKALNNLVKQIENYSLEGKTKQQEKAFWINAYNILVIKGIIEHYPVQSPMKIPGFFDAKKHLAAGQKLTLNQIENKKIRAVYHDARIHFVLVCAAVSCPPITNFAYKPGNLDDQLEQQTIKALNDDKFIRVNQENQSVGISEIFKWYAEDFKTNGKGFIEYINLYRKEKIPPGYKVEFYSYDWSLNEIKTPQARQEVQNEIEPKKKTSSCRT